MAEPPALASATAQRGAPAALAPPAPPLAVAVPPLAEPSFTQRWHAYYTQKRIVHQWFQVHLLSALTVRRVLEVGPYLGLVTAMLASAGYEVTTFDVADKPPPVGARAHVQGNLLALDPARIRGFDAILCCETLEHMPWSEVGGVLAALAASGTPYLVLSVPYEGAQIGWSFYANAHTLRHRLFTRWLRFLQRFRVASLSDIDAHKWEVGYKGCSLATLRKKVAASGWRPVAQHFTEGCRSVFLVCRNSEVR